MKRFNLAIAAVAAVGVGFLAGCGGTTPEADKAAIEEINKAWLAAIVAKDAGKISEIYAEDGQMMPPNTAKAVGREAIKKGWEGFLGIPGMALTFETLMQEPSLPEPTSLRFCCFFLVSIIVPGAVKPMA